MVSNFKNNWTSWHHIFHKAILAENKLLPKGSHLLVSVSGGQDSMALLTLLDDIKKQHNWSLHVWHGDHRWHKKSQYIANELKKYCFQKNIIFYLDIANPIDVKTEEKAREWRYKKLCETASLINNEDRSFDNLEILTGHTSTDNTETFFLNLARGTNFNGVAGIKKKRSLNQKYFLTRPFLFFTRENTASICKDLQIPYWEDPTNSDISLRRNFIRYKIINELEKIYPGCSLRISNFVNKMKNYNEERSELCELAIKSCLSDQGINRYILNNLSAQTRSTILYYVLKKICVKQISSKNVDYLSEQILQKNYGQKNFSNGITIIWNKNLIKIIN